MSAVAIIHDTFKPSNARWRLSSNENVSIIENEFCMFELWVNGKGIAMSEHPSSLLRYAYVNKFIGFGQMTKLANNLHVDVNRIFEGWGPE